MSDGAISAIRHWGALVWGIVSTTAAGANFAGTGWSAMAVDPGG